MFMKSRAGYLDWVVPFRPGMGKPGYRAEGQSRASHRQKPVDKGVDVAVACESSSGVSEPDTSDGQIWNEVDCWWEDLRHYQVGVQVRQFLREVTHTHNTERTR